MSHRGLSRPEPNAASSPTLQKDPPLKVQITHTHTYTAKRAKPLRAATPVSCQRSIQWAPSWLSNRHARSQARSLGALAQGSEHGHAGLQGAVGA